MGQLSVCVWGVLMYGTAQCVYMEWPNVWVSPVYVWNGLVYMTVQCVCMECTNICDSLCVYSVLMNGTVLCVYRVS